MFYKYIIYITAYAIFGLICVVTFVIGYSFHYRWGSPRKSPGRYRCMCWSRHFFLQPYWSRTELKVDDWRIDFAACPTFDKSLVLRIRDFYSPSTVFYLRWFAAARDQLSSITLYLSATTAPLPFPLHLPPLRIFTKETSRKARLVQKGYDERFKIDAREKNKWICSRPRWPWHGVPRCSPFCSAWPHFFSPYNEFQRHADDDRFEKQRQWGWRRKLNRFRAGSRNFHGVDTRS